MTKTALTRLCALFIYQCARAAEAHISWWGQERKVKNTFGRRYFPKLSIFLRAPSKFSSKGASPTVPPPIPPTLMWKTKPNHFRLWDLSFVRVRLPSLSKSFQPSHKRSPWKSDKNLGDPSLTRSEHQYFEHTVLSRHRPPFRPPARSNARPPACQTAVCLPA